VTCERTDLELGLVPIRNLCSVYGFRKLGLQNTEIDAMIRRDFSRLKKVWERRSHFVPLEVIRTTGVWGLSDGFYERIGTLLRASMGISNAILKPEAEDAEQNRRFMQSWGERLQEGARSTSLRERR
jgi:hypothetical protein